MTIVEHKSVCRYCAGSCGVIAGVEDNRLISIRGDKQHPLSRGYTCIKGLQGDYALNAPDRILRPLKRTPSGGFEEISLTQALDEIAEQIRSLIVEDGPQAVATFKGTQAYFNAPLSEMLPAWSASIGSSSFFSTMTIDQSAKWVAVERTGLWAGDRHHFLDSDVVMIVGANPLLSIGVGGMVTLNTTKQFKAAKQRGMKLIVIDPRRSETAVLADLHLQVRPGEDPTLLAGILREILVHAWEDADFCRDYVAQLDELRSAVDGFTVEYVEHRTGIPSALIREAARMFAHDQKRGFATTGTGPSMAPHSNLSEHLVECLNITCGRMNRAGDIIRNAGVLRPRTMVAEVIPPRRSWESGPKSRVRGFGSMFGEMMSATIPEEILTPGKGRIRAFLVSGGNPASAFPDQEKSIAALKALALLVAVEPSMTATAKLAHYILPPTLQYERDDLLLGPRHERFNPEPFQQFISAIVPPPAGSELIDDWRVFWELASRLDKQIVFCGQPLDKTHAPTTEDLLRLLMAQSPVSLDELKQHPGGKMFDLPPVTVRPGRIAPDLRFQVAPPDVTAELAVVLQERQPIGSVFTHKLISRRMREVLNTLGLNWPTSRQRVPYNPAYFHPSELARLGLEPGDKIEIESDHGAIEAIVDADDSLCGEVISMSHCWGGLPEDHEPYEKVGSCTSRLVSIDRDYETINAMPRMSAIPVRIRSVHKISKAVASS